MKLKKIYNKDFYNNQEAGSLRSAKIILPMVLDIIRPKSIVDFGCGVGPWLKVAKVHGCSDCLGIEGEWVLEKVKTPSFHFKIQDLNKRVTLKKRYDLAISMEVAEHLKPSRADSFVNDLCISFLLS